MPLKVFFFLCGFAQATWTVRIPAIKDQVGASTTELGLALLCLSIGGIVSMAIGGRLCLRFGSQRAVVVAGAATSAALPLPALAESVSALATALVVYGATYGLFNISLNSSAVDVEAALRRPVMSGLHGLYSAGSLAGAVAGGTATALSPATHLALVAGAGLAISIGFGILLLRAHRAAPPVTRSTPDSGTRLWGVVWILGVIAFCTAFAEFANNDWAVLHLRDDVHASARLAAYGYAAYELAITVARLTGNRLIVRFGRRAVLVGGCVLATVGIVVAAQTGVLAFSIAAYVVVGLGVANIFPIAVARAGALGGPRAVSLVAPMGSAGILIERPLIGFLADQVGLPNALSAVALLTILAGCLGLAATRSPAKPSQTTATESSIP